MRAGFCVSEAYENKEGNQMARSKEKVLDTGDIFPAFEFNTTEGDKILLPRDLGNKWNVFLIYRGYW
jgi:hypothetical protein